MAIATIFVSVIPPADEAWTAVLNRDAQFDGRFVYGVRSTGVYCRPSCPSRRPRRDNVSFFANPSDAERAGHRACRRCRPRAPRTPTATLVARACAWLDTNADRRATLADLADAMGVSAFHLQRTFKRVTGISPRAYREARRSKALRESVRSAASITDAQLQAGLSSSSRLYARTRSQLGMTPSAFRKGGKDQVITYAIGASSLGQVLVATTERGVCAVSLADDDETLLAWLQREFPSASFERAPSRLSDALTNVLSRLRGDSRSAQLPLDIRGTAFQRRVWEALLAVPPGETRSYRDLALALGAPRGARAVARACATNRIAVLVPCHRVLRGDGSLGGYRWGLERKQRLLDRERGA